MNIYTNCLWIFYMIGIGHCMINNYTKDDILNYFGDINQQYNNTIIYDYTDTNIIF